jgi:hypothetical protein
MPRPFLTMIGPAGNGHAVPMVIPRPAVGPGRRPHGLRAPGGGACLLGSALARCPEHLRARGIVKGVIVADGRAVAAGLSGVHQALGGGGLAHWLVRLFIWHELWRLIRVIWRIPTFGPIILFLIVLALVGLIVLARRGRVRWPRRSRGGPAGHGTGSPRDW